MRTIICLLYLCLLQHWEMCRAPTWIYLEYATKSWSQRRLKQLTCQKVHLGASQRVRVERGLFHPEDKATLSSLPHMETFSHARSQLVAALITLTITERFFLLLPRISICHVIVCVRMPVFVCVWLYNPSFLLLHLIVVRRGRWIEWESWNAKVDLQPLGAWLALIQEGSPVKTAVLVIVFLFFTSMLQFPKDHFHYKQETAEEKKKRKKGENKTS